MLVHHLLTRSLAVHEEDVAEQEAAHVLVADAGLDARHEAEVLAQIAEHLPPVAHLRAASQHELHAVRQPGVVGAALHQRVVHLAVGAGHEGAHDEQRGDEELLLAQREAQHRPARGQIVQRQRLRALVGPHAAQLAGELGVLCATVGEGGTNDAGHVVTAGDDEKADEAVDAVDDEEAALLGGLLVPRQQLVGAGVLKVAACGADHDGDEAHALDGLLDGAVAHLAVEVDHQRCGVGRAQLAALGGEDARVDAVVAARGVADGDGLDADANGGEALGRVGVDGDEGKGGHGEVKKAAGGEHGVEGGHVGGEEVAEGAEVIGGGEGAGGGGGGGSRGGGGGGASGGWSALTGWTCGSGFGGRSSRCGGRSGLLR